jgi:hypothetical protein
MADKNNFAEIAFKVRDGRQGIVHDTGCLFFGKSVDAGTDVWKSEAFDSVFRRKGDHACVARGKRFGFAAFPTVPDWPYRVNDERRSQFVSFRQSRVSRLKVPDFRDYCPAFFVEFRPRRVVNGSVDTAATRESGVCCIDNRPDIEPGDIPPDDRVFHGLPPGTVYANIQPDGKEMLRRLRFSGTGAAVCRSIVQKKTVF